MIIIHFKESLTFNLRHQRLVLASPEKTINGSIKYYDKDTKTNRKSLNVHKNLLVCPSKNFSIEKHFNK